MRNIRENEEFNKAVSRVRIRSEHTIGYLKGRFHSLKHLRVRIKDRKSHKFATYWVAGCIVLHAFAMKCKAEEMHAQDSDNEDPFIAEGLAPSSDEDNTANAPPLATNQTDLQAGKEKREALKRALFWARERRAVQRDVDSSSGSA